MKGFTQEQAYKARNADLASFLLATDPEHYKIEGHSIRMLDLSKTGDKGTGIVIPMGKSWAHDFVTNKTWNAVDFLKEKLNYSLIDAIKALSGETVEYHKAEDSKAVHQEKAKLPPKFPEPSDTQRQMYAYLKSRGIPSDTVKQLSQLGILYQSKDHNNLVFVNQERDFAELRGTCSFGKGFHGVIKNQADRFWSFAIGRPEKVYICESAIDAISLYLLNQKEGTENNAAYVSIAGVANQQTIDRIKNSGLNVVIAVDNDHAGDICRDKNPDCEAIIPSRKDWNADLVDGPLSLDELIDQATEKQSEFDFDDNCVEPDDLSID